VRAADGAVDIYYQDLTTPKVSVPREATGCYFKAGAYTQSNPSRGDAPTAYGEVVIYALSVTHQ
jgi:poly(beta-D-mannuronate) lyase